MKRFILILKLFFSIFLIWFVFSRLDRKYLYEILHSNRGLYAIFICCIAIFFQAFVVALRLKIILKVHGCISDFATCTKTILIGNFFSQTMISFLGGDAMRIWFLNRKAIPVRLATSVILLDRVIGFIALILLSVLFLPSLMKIVSDATMWWGLVFLTTISISAIVVFVALGMLPKSIVKHKWLSLISDFISVSRYLFISYRATIFLLILGLLTHFLNVLAIYGMLQTYESTISLFWCMAIIPTVMLITMLPISIGGWGVRESAMAVGFGLLGYSSDITITVSIIFGISLALCGLPGAILFLMEKKRVSTGVYTIEEMI